MEEAFVLQHPERPPRNVDTAFPAYRKRRSRPDRLPGSPLKKLLTALAVIGLWASPAFGQADSPELAPEADVLTAVPRELRAGEATTVTGEGCAPGNTVRFILSDPDPGPSVEAIAQGDGTFVQTIVLPSTTKVGRAWLRATCITPDSESKVMEAVLLVSRPKFVITWTNVIFGIGTALITAGIGLAMLKQSDSSKHPSGRGKSRRRRKGRKSSSRTRTSKQSPISDRAPELNGVPKSAERLEAD